MDYMFKEVPNLISINMTSNKDCKILSMISSFQNDRSFEYFTISGFNAEQIKFMKYCFYNSSLFRFSFNSFDSKSLEDITYMFSRTKLYSFSLNGLNTINVKNLSHFFEDNLNLEEFNQEGFKTSQARDISYKRKRGRADERHFEGRSEEGHDGARDTERAQHVG